MEEQSKTLAVSVRAKEFVSYHCSCCGHCCRHIENCVMVESLDAYRMAMPQLMTGLSLACNKAMQHDCFG